MCDPLTILGAVAGIGSSLFGSKKDKPPPKPAMAPPEAKKDVAKVKIGTENKTEQTTGTDYVGFEEKRKSGTALGGLGRGGLTI